MSVRIAFSTKLYREAHGELPHGRAQWVFIVGGEEAGEWLTAPYPHFVDARRWAAEEVRARAEASGHMSAAAPPQPDEFAERSARIQQLQADAMLKLFDVPKRDQDIR